MFPLSFSLNNFPATVYRGILADNTSIVGYWLLPLLLISAESRVMPSNPWTAGSRLDDIGCCVCLIEFFGSFEKSI